MAFRQTQHAAEVLEISAAGPVFLSLPSNPITVCPRSRVRFTVVTLGPAISMPG
uniref:Uncharacterized protein n=1 Tax=Anguilla anguilla TaxID=7936 RepID=A0A0E9UIU9_ANGAN